MKFIVNRNSINHIFIVLIFLIFCNKTILANTNKVDITRVILNDSIGSLQDSMLKLTRKRSIDIDFITIPVKFRWGNQYLEPQLNGVISGAVYLGYKWQFQGKGMLLNNNLALSIGAFSGIGNTFISPTTTYNRLDKEYDGIVWMNGIALFIANNKINFGVLLAIDQLLDVNADIWIYQKKPYLGFAIGLNLN